MLHREGASCSLRPSESTLRGADGMQKTLLALTALALAALAAFCSATQAPGNARAVGENPMDIRVESKNPWTSLELNNQPRNFQFAIVTDRTGGHRPGVFADAVR